MRFQQLLEYRDKHGDCKVPQHYKENKALGKWTAKQREQYKLYKKGQHSFLTPYRLEKLNQIGFVWQVRSGNDGEEDPLDEGKEAAHDEAAAVGGAVKVEGDAAVAAAAAAAAAVGGTGAMKEPPPAAAAMGQKNDHDALVAEAAALAAAEVKTEEAIITANV
jgi:Helicase associated domain